MAESWSPRSGPASCTSFRIDGESLATEAVIDRWDLNPHGIAVHRMARKAYVGLVATAQVAEVDLASQPGPPPLRGGELATLSDRLARWSVVLAVGNGGDANIMVLDTANGEQLYEEPLANGTNLGQMRTSADGKYAYFTWMVYRTNPINVGNIRRGWVLASRIGRVRLRWPVVPRSDFAGRAAASGCRSA